MKKIWPAKSTIVRAFIQPARHWLPLLTARLAEAYFTRTHPRPVPRLGLTERPQHTWEIPAENETLKVYGWGASLEIAEKIALVSHGWNSNAWDLYPLIESLRELGYTVVAADQIGHGRSTGRHSNFPQFARTLERVSSMLPRLDLVVGHSMGAAAAALALSRGLQAGAAVLLAPPADVRHYLQRFAEGFGLSQRAYQKLQANLELRERVELARLVPEVILPHLRMPALIVCDAKDREVSLESAQRYATHWPGAQLAVTEGLGHRRVASHPSSLNHIKGFLQNLPKSPLRASCGGPFSRTVTC